MEDNQPAMSLINGGVGNTQGQPLPEEAIKSANKVLNKYYDKHAEDIAASPGGIEVLHHLVNKANNQQEQKNYDPSVGQQAKDVINPQHISLLGRILNNTAWGQNLQQSKLENLQKAQTVMNQSSPEGMVTKMANLNKVIDKQLPGYQVTQNTDGNFIIHPKAAGMMAALDPTQLNSLSNSLVNGKQVPSQLPRMQKGQIIAAALDKDPTYNPAQADMDFAANKVGAEAFKKNFNALYSYEGDFSKNADYLLTLNDSFVRSKIPLINRAIIAGAQNISGDPQAAKFLQTIRTVGNTFARLQNPTLSGQALTDAGRQESQEMLNKFQNGETVKSLLNPVDGSMRVEVKNRLDAAQNTMDKLNSTYKKSSDKKTPGGDYQSYLKSIGQ